MPLDIKDIIFATKITRANAPLNISILIVKKKSEYHPKCKLSILFISQTLQW